MAGLGSILPREELEERLEIAQSAQTIAQSRAREAEATVGMYDTQVDSLMAGAKDSLQQCRAELSMREEELQRLDATRQQRGLSLDDGEQAELQAMMDWAQTLVAQKKLEEALRSDFVQELNSAFTPVRGIGVRRNHSLGSLISSYHGPDSASPLGVSPMHGDTDPLPRLAESMLSTSLPAATVGSGQGRQIRLQRKSIAELEMARRIAEERAMQLKRRSELAELELKNLQRIISDNKDPDTFFAVLGTLVRLLYTRPRESVAEMVLWVQTLVRRLYVFVLCLFPTGRGSLPA